MNLTPPNPIASEGERGIELPDGVPFTGGQLAHLAKTSGAERRQWEGYYGEQNRKAKEAAEEESAKAKRLEELKRILPDEPI